MIHSKSLTKRAFSFAMLYRFISLILISVLSVGAIAKDSCAAVSKDCDDLGKQVDVVEAAMQKFLTSHSRSDGLVGGPVFALSSFVNLVLDRRATMRLSIWLMF